MGDDDEAALAESTITDLMATYPDNLKVEHILIEVIVINTLYHAGVLDIDWHPLANHMLIGNSNVPAAQIRAFPPDG